MVAAKSHFGNLGAGGGMVELIASLLAMQHGRLFPILNYATPDPECPVAAVRNGDVPPGDSFVNLNVTPQGQAAAVLVRRIRRVNVIVRLIAESQLLPHVQLLLRDRSSTSSIVGAAKVAIGGVCTCPFPCLDAGQAQVPSHFSLPGSWLDLRIRVVCRARVSAASWPRWSDFYVATGCGQEPRKRERLLPSRR